jgi:peptide/nickel transport system permease protein
MIRFLIRRIVSGIVVLWVTTVAVFALFFVAPHNVAQIIAGRQATQQTVALVRARLGLNKPVLYQYWEFVVRLVHGNLGYSYYNSEPVTQLLASRFSVTASIAIGGGILWLVMGVMSGVISARRPRSLIDRGITVVALIFYSMPTFLLGIVLLYFLFFQLHLAGIDFFPGSGYVAISSDPLGWAQHMLLPWFTVALTSAGTYTRLTRTGMLEVLSEDYIRTARSKGVGEGRIIFVHALRSALTSVVTQFGIDLGILLGGAVVTESIFGLPGLGQLAILSMTEQDLPVVTGIVMIGAVFVVVGNIVVDMIYPILDPRVRLR